MTRSPVPELIVAVCTPLTDDGRALDLDAIERMVRFLEERGIDGVFCCGTTGEGVLLSLEERKRVVAAFRGALRGRLIVHAGAQTTADTAALAAHAAEIGADGVGVIPPSYYLLDDAALEEHLVAAAAACAPLPFFIYAFTARSGYPVPVELIARVRERVDNLAGIKCSESPFERVEPYLDLGLPVYIGNEPMLPQALARGAAGTVSGLAAALPDVIRAAIDTASSAGQQPDEQVRVQLSTIRAEMERQPFIASVKHVLRRRGVAIQASVRAPQRWLTPDEARRLDAWLDSGVAALTWASSIG